MGPGTVLEWTKGTDVKQYSSYNIFSLVSHTFENSKRKR